MSSARPTYGLERLWLAADRLADTGEAPPFVNQLVIRGEGTLDLQGWTDAVTRASAAWRLLSVRAAGVLHAARWEPGPPPRVREVDGDAWSGDEPDGAAWLAERLLPEAGPVAEVVLVRGATPRVCFRTHHAIVDGRAAQGFAADVLRVLRGEAARGAPPPPRRDTELASGAARAGPLAPVRAFAWRPGTYRAVTWRRARYDGSCARLLPRALHALAAVHAEVADGGTHDILRVSVPMDLRPLELSGACANLSGLGRVDVHQGTSVDALRDAIDAARPHAGDVLRVADSLRWLPLALLTAGARRAARDLATTGLADASATVSNLGRADLDALSGGGFVAAGTYWIPPGSPGNACFVSLSGDRTGADIVMAAPIPPEAIHDLLVRMVRQLRATA